MDFASHRQNCASLNPLGYWLVQGWLIAISLIAFVAAIAVLTGISPP